MDAFCRGLKYSRTDVYVPLLIRGDRQGTLANLQIGGGYREYRAGFDPFNLETTVCGVLK